MFCGDKIDKYFSFELDRLVVLNKQQKEYNYE